MSRKLKALLERGDDSEGETSTGKTMKKTPHWLRGIQTDRSVTYDTSEMFEAEEMEKKKQMEQSLWSKKCYDCGEFGHIAKECPNKWRKRQGARFKDSDWNCPMCGNINWDWRTICNKCTTPKPSGATEKRTGKGGGYNEIDEETRARIAERRAKKGNISQPPKKEKDSPLLNVSEAEGNPRIYVTGLNTKEVSIEELARHFGQIGRIKRDRRGIPKIKLYKDDNGDLNGDGVITHEDAHAAPFAIQWFHDTEFQNSKLAVQPAEQEEFEEEEEEPINPDAALEAELFGLPTASRGRGRGRGRGGGSTRGRGGPPVFAPDDWKCDICGNVNWARREKCNRCAQPKPETIRLLQEQKRREMEAMGVLPTHPSSPNKPEPKPYYGFEVEQPPHPMLSTQTQLAQQYQQKQHSANGTPAHKERDRFRNDRDRDRDRERERDRDRDRHRNRERSRDRDRHRASRDGSGRHKGDDRDRYRSDHRSDRRRR